MSRRGVNRRRNAAPIPCSRGSEPTSTPRDAGCQITQDLPVFPSVGGWPDHRSAVAGDVSDSKGVQQQVVVIVLQREGAGQDDVGVSGGLVQVEVDRHHEFQGIQGSLQPAGIRPTQDRVAGQRHQRPDLPAAGSLDLLGKAGQRQLAAELRQSPHPA